MKRVLLVTSIAVATIAVSRPKTAIADSVVVQQGTINLIRPLPDRILTTYFSLLHNKRDDSLTGLSTDGTKRITLVPTRCDGTIIWEVSPSPTDRYDDTYVSHLILRNDGTAQVRMLCLPRATRSTAR